MDVDDDKVSSTCGIAAGGQNSANIESVVQQRDLYSQTSLIMFGSGPPQIPLNINGSCFGGVVDSVHYITRERKHRHAQGSSL